MKKAFILLLTILFFTTSALADVRPKYSDSILHTGIGVFNSPNEFVMYSKPDLKSNVVAKVEYNQDGVFLNGKPLQENEIFFAFTPNKGIAYTVVDDETDGWVKIYYLQSKAKSAWVKTTSTNYFRTWRGFITALGRANGVYFAKDMPENYRGIYSAPKKDAQRLGTFQLPRFIKMTVVRGNWMLVTIQDLNYEKKVGWMQWRSEEGKFYIFPTIK